MTSIIWLIDQVIGLYIMVVVGQVILSWLVAFSVVNTSNRFVYMVGDFFYRATEPALKRIRRVMPNLGGLDISPIILILALVFAQRLLVFDIAPALR